MRSSSSAPKLVYSILIVNDWLVSIDLGSAYRGLEVEGFLSQLNFTPYRNWFCIDFCNRNSYFENVWVQSRIFGHFLQTIQN